MNAPLTPARLDAVLAGKPEKLWGAPAIAAALGVSVDTVREWARDPAVPIYRPKGYFARRSELERWLRTKPFTEDLPLLQRRRPASI